jgi:hypothetical protein
MKNRESSSDENDFTEKPLQDSKFIRVNDNGRRTNEALPMQGRVTETHHYTTIGEAKYEKNENVKYVLSPASLFSPAQQKNHLNSTDHQPAERDNKISSRLTGDNNREERITFVGSTSHQHMSKSKDESFQTSVMEAPISSPRNEAQAEATGSASYDHTMSFGQPPVYTLSNS